MLWKGSGNGNSHLDIGARASSVVSQQDLTPNLSRFSGERPATAFTLVEYLATTLLPRKRERRSASVLRLWVADELQQHGVKDSALRHRRSPSTSLTRDREIDKSFFLTVRQPVGGTPPTFGVYSERNLVLARRIV